MQIFTEATTGDELYLALPLTDIQNSLVVVTVNAASLTLVTNDSPARITSAEAGVPSPVLPPSFVMPVVPCTRPAASESAVWQCGWYCRPAAAQILRELGELSAFSSLHPSCSCMFIA